VVNCEEHPLEQVTKQLNKLINVIKMLSLSRRRRCSANYVDQGPHRHRQPVQGAETVELFRRAWWTALDAVTVEATGSHDKLEALGP
jgi:acetolactate synthase-1/3 small subunit